MDMNVNEFLDEMKKIQTNLLDFLSHEDIIEEKFQNLLNIFEDIKIHDNQFKVKLVFYLILKISNNYHRESQFFSRIEKIMQLFEEDMKKYFTNDELFQIFESNKRLLLFLFEEQIIKIDESIVKQIINQPKYIDCKYPQYFQPEIQPFTNEEWFPKCNKSKNNKSKNSISTKNKSKITNWFEEITNELPEDFYEKRKIGENDDEICKLIQKDLIEEFIIYVNKNFYPVNSIINPSIYETNSFLLKNKDITLIEYSVFFGSIQIFNYLRQNGAKLNSSLWLYAVHGNNPEIIHFLEENKNLLSKDDKFLQKKEEEEEEDNDDDDDFDIPVEQIFKESIKCHHNGIANYIQDNYLQNNNKNSKNALKNSLKYYNFMFIQYNVDNDILFYYSCKYDYYLLTFILLKDINIDINKEHIYIVVF